MEFQEVLGAFGGVILGYARISTDDQSLDDQTDALPAVGAGHVFSDNIIGSLGKRPQPDRLLHQLRPGDVVVSPDTLACRPP